MKDLSQSLKPFNFITSLMAIGLKNVAEISYEIEKIHK
jgi:hypothetical protein